MRTHGHREGNNTHRAKLGSGGEWRGGTAGDVRRMGGITPGQMPDVSNSRGWMETANHHGMYVPMQQSCRIQDVHMYPRAQIQLKKKKESLISEAQVHRACLRLR